MHLKWDAKQSAVRRFESNATPAVNNKYDKSAYFFLEWLFIVNKKQTRQGLTKIDLINNGGQKSWAKKLKRSP